MEQTVFLRPEVVIEPRVNSWYAWPFLIYPATLGMVTKNSHLKILDSFIKSPQIHHAAAKNPAMLGGPFLNYDGAPDHVQSLLDATRADLGPQIELATQIAALAGRLSEFTGESLDRVYAELPPALRGLTELRYDFRHVPSFRLLEALVYARYSTDALQTLHFVKHDPEKRPFALSTPALEAQDMTLRIPFRNADVDFFSRARLQACSLLELSERISKYTAKPVTPDDLQSWVTPDKPLPGSAPEFDGAGMRIRYFGHASVLLQTAQFSLMVDPCVSSVAEHGPQRFGFLDLPERIDYVLLTHCHQDHVLLETLLALRHKIGTLLVPKSNGNGLTDPSLRLILKACGFQNIIELAEMDELPCPGGKILGLPFFGEHGDLDINGKLAYGVLTDQGSVAFLADSNNLDSEVYAQVAQITGPLDVLFIGMECEGAPMSWLYGSLLQAPLSRAQDQARRLNGSDSVKAAQIVDCFQPAAVFVYAMGAEPWVTFLSSVSYSANSRPIVESTRLLQHLQERAIHAERLYGNREIHLRDRTLYFTGAPQAEPFLK
ncbi:MBL fold metallo-hydrolase [Massilia sp. W12]|uniref:MBL fold metallo-hydrolase n=1 Tax=Massilia sp. W12 TaxID=3126507 RepID=UPI0030CEA06C